MLGSTWALRHLGTFSYQVSGFYREDAEGFRLLNLRRKGFEVSLTGTWAVRHLGTFSYQVSGFYREDAEGFRLLNLRRKGFEVSLTGNWALRHLGTFLFLVSGFMTGGTSALWHLGIAAVGGINAQFRVIIAGDKQTSAVKEHTVAQ